MATTKVVTTETMMETEKMVTTRRVKASTMGTMPTTTTNEGKLLRRLQSSVWLPANILKLNQFPFLKQKLQQWSIQRIL